MHYSCNMDNKNCVVALALADTIKRFQQRLKFLEEQAAAAAAKPTMEIDARISGNTVLIKVICQQRKGLLVKILGELEKLNMAVVTATLTTFGCSTLDITVVAQMQMNLETVDIVATLRSALQPAHI